MTRAHAHDTAGPVTWFWVDVPWACGGVAADARGVVVDAAPIFRRAAMGRPLNAVILAWRRPDRSVRVRWVRLPLT